jgi:hypothetical protein
MLMGKPPFPLPQEGDPEGLLARVESGSYPRLGSTHRRLPRVLRRIVRRCLKPKASRRIASATAIREPLESLLGRPSDVELRRSLASWLWGRHVFEARTNETVVMLAPAAGSSSVRRRGLRWAMALALGAAGLLGYSLQHPVEVATWSEQVVAQWAAPD